MVEFLDLVDENDRVIGCDSRTNIYKKGMHNYRVVGIFLIDNQSRILLPIRSLSCEIFPGCYDFSIAGHVLSGESYQDAAEREAEEELGIKKNTLDLKEFLYTVYPNKHGLSSFSKYYYAFYKGEKLSIDEEYTSYEWLPYKKIKKMVSVKPELFKGDFLPVFDLLSQYIDGDQDVKERGDYNA